MSERIITLFGEEVVPEQIKAVGKSRARKKLEEKKPEEKKEIETETPVVEEEKSFVIPEDWQGDKQYYSIGEVATLFKVKTSHIRFWTNEFKLKVRTTRKGDRMYTPAQVRELRAIHHLVKERGFTLTGAKAKLKSQNRRDVETIDLKQSLLQLRNKLLIIRNKLR
jgi:DNA-binding transcriptional MerR regulator